jgi:diguanylate cyclase (GGDEF)-like protein
LTGLLSSEGLERRLGAMLHQAVADDVSLSVIMTDVNHLKEINRRHGRPTGDQILSSVAGALKAALNPQDVCWRLGGDAFVIALWDVGKAQVRDRARALRGAVGQIVIRAPDGTEVIPSIVAGAATYPDNGLTAKALLRAADRQMQVIKAKEAVLA